MKSFWVDFNGYCAIEAETEEDARLRFWKYVKAGGIFPESAYGITDIEEREEDE